MTPASIIEKKRDGYELRKDELQTFIRGITTGEIADYQASAFLMAVYFQGMTLNETVALTEVMLQSGDQYDLSQIPGCKVDKHSTGGVGDKVSLILAPLAAACGLKVPMMSGRGLGHSGGTLDKLESIQGFDVNLSRENFEAILNKVGCAMTGQTEKIAPADKKLYALRDVTATVNCIPLITASILSKKLAEGANALVLDVKVGSGAFMKTREQARKLAKTLTLVAKKMGLPCRAILTSMNQPLGYAVGNAIEVRESIDILKNEKTKDLCSADLKALTVHLCAHMLEIGGVARSLSEGRKLAHLRLMDGSAWRVFQDLVQSQGGNLQQIQNATLLPEAPRKVIWTAPSCGYVAKIDTAEIGKLLIHLGGGRKKASDAVDPGVGIIFHRKLGNKVQEGDPLVTLHTQPHTDLSALESQFHQAFQIHVARKAVPKLIYEHYSSEVIP